MMIIAGNWWTFVLRGLAAILFAVLTFFVPGITLLTLIFIFGFYAIFDGVFNIVAAIRRTAPAQQPWWALLLQGILGMIAGLIALLLPGLTALALLYLICAWAIVTGAMAIVAAIRLRKHIHGEWLLALSGLLAIVCGVLAAIFPPTGALAFVLWIGAYAFVYGVLMISLGFRVRSLVHRLEQQLPGGNASVIPGH